MHEAVRVTNESLTLPAKRHWRLAASVGKSLRYEEMQGLHASSCYNVSCFAWIVVVHSAALCSIAKFGMMLCTRFRGEYRHLCTCSLPLQFARHTLGCSCGGDGWASVRIG